MELTRREFLRQTGVAVAAGAIAPAETISQSTAVAQTQSSVWNWQSIRDQFDLSREHIHMASFFLASHPKPVREAIDKYRKMIDRNPFDVVEHALFSDGPGNLYDRTCAEAAGYLGSKPEYVAITNSTTMGLALIYNGLALRAGDEILTTEHDHYSHHESIRLAVEKAGAKWKRIPLFDSYDSITEAEIVARIRRAITPATRAVGITWVHSSTGVKLPLRQIGSAIQVVNASREQNDQVLLIVDGVHGFGVEDETIAQTGCHFFAAGTHKWLFGPRGTGLVWGSAQAWSRLRPTIPTFYSDDVYEAWMDNRQPSTPTRASWVSPGGFHAFEHEWAVADAFQFHQQIGKARVAERIHSLNQQCKDGLAKMKNVKLYTPKDSRLSAGLICFDIEGHKPEDVVEKLLEKKIVASTTPYKVYYARLAPSLVNSPEEVEQTLRAIREIVA
jgi:isopenicillin-N epimerase